MSGGDGMSGHHLGDLLSALVDGEMAGPGRQAAEDHLSSCQLCRAEWEQTARVHVLVAELPSLDLPPAVWAAVMVGGRRRARSRVWVGAAAAVVALAFLAASPPQHHVTPQMAHLVQDHATLSGTDPVTQLAPAAVQASFRK
jgi:predicted anti-sigma-YlaC factor YlaD